MMRRWTENELETIRAMYANTKNSNLAMLLGRTESAVYQAAEKLGLKKSAAYLASPDACRLRKGARIGEATQFKPGYVPWNKGMNFNAGGRSAETQFKPGSRPHNWHPIGHERLSKEGYLQRKISDTGCTRKDYVPVHHLIWKDAGREIPPGHTLTFRDGNKRNFALENLELVSRRELMRRNSYHNYPKEVALAIQLRGALNRKINRLAKEART
ncbi:MAG: HNH endonuclease signature motif containing protein [Sulfuricella sp.]|nr:HNH endonuclease signature motif containing protein [Sulfuricella sp.]